MKKLINKVENVEIEMIQGIAKAHPDILEQLPGHTILVRKNKKTDKVALISGGGSGHEPAHGGFVGYGMLDAAVAGAVFTSPTPDQVKAAIDAVGTPAGVLLVIKNYTGDVMNFEMAGELAEMDGIPVKSVIMNDDVAVKDSLYTTGRRGVAGTIFIHKIAGAKAEEGASLEEVARVAEKVIANTRTMGMSLTAGTHREKLRTADEIADTLLEKILADIDYQGHEVALMINGCGGTPLMELYIVNNHVHDVLESKGIHIYKTFVGNYMTSLEMAGFAISILRLDDETKALLDAPANTPAFKM